MGNKSQKTIIKHHQQVDNAKIRNLQREYQREAKHQEYLQYRNKMKAFGIAWEIFKAVYLACVIITLVSAGMWAVRMLYGI